jgi:hypothetical protein
MRPGVGGAANYLHFTAGLLFALLSALKAMSTSERRDG